MGKNNTAYGILVGIPEGRKLLQRGLHRRVDNIKMDLGDMGSSVIDWIDLAQNVDQWRALVNMAMNFPVP
jgi:hypothetical protein